MFSPLWQFEWRLLRAERSFWLLTLLLFALTALAVQNGRQWTLLQSHTIDVLRVEETRRLDSLKAVFERIAAGDTSGIAAFNDPRLPSVAGSRHTGRWLFLPPGPLEVLSVGQSDLYPYFVRLTTLTRQSAVISDEVENPLTLLTGRLDSGFVLLVVYPLLVLALAYNFIAHERELGTLALLMAQPVHARTVLMRKLAVRIVALLFITGVLIFVAAVAGGVELKDSDTLARLMWWLAVVELYGLFWFAVAIATNAHVKTSAGNAVVVMAAWFVCVVGIPAIGNAIVAALYPVPSRISLTSALRAEENAQATQSPNYATALSDFLAGHPIVRNVATTDTLNPQMIAVIAADKLERKIRPVFDEFDSRLRMRQDAADRLRILSPTLAAYSALLDLAGTGTTRYREFDERYAQAHEVWRSFFNRKIFASAPFRATDINSLPRFNWQEERVTALRGRLSTNIIAIVLPAVLLVSLSLPSLRRLHNPSI